MIIRARGRLVADPGSLSRAKFVQSVARSAKLALAIGTIPRFDVREQW